MDEKQKIYSTRCWIDNKLQPATVSYANGVITDIAFSKVPGAEDFGDLVIMPGVIDAHVHVNEPGRTDWEGFETATLAAAAGGITTIVDMPLNASPVTTTLPAFEEKLDAAKNKLHVNCGFYGGLVPGNTDQLEPLIHAGVLGIKCFLTHSGIDEFPNVTAADLDSAMPIFAKYKIPLLAHCELYDEEVDCGFADHPTSYQHYLSSRPKQWENDAIALMIEKCRQYNCPVHIVHVSSAEALTLIHAAKAEGLPLTAETCPQYIYFSAENIPDANCVYKCAPPIREKANNDLLKKALADGTLDLIATDHSPAPPGMKEIVSGNFAKAWGGIAGIQFLLPASWTALEKNMELETFIPLISEHPAKMIGLAGRKGSISVGYDADLSIWNPEKKHIVKEENILFRHKISPYIGAALLGVVQQTIVNGMTVFKAGQIVETNAGLPLKTKRYGNNNHSKEDL